MLQLQFMFLQIFQIGNEWHFLDGFLLIMILFWNNKLEVLSLLCLFLPCFTILLLVHVSRSPLAFLRTPLWFICYPFKVILKWKIFSYSIIPRSFSLCRIRWCFVGVELLCHHFYSVLKMIPGFNLILAIRYFWTPEKRFIL